MARFTLTQLVSVAASVLSLIAGCAPDSAVNELSEDVVDSEDALSLPIEIVNVTKSNAPAGLTILTKKADYVAFFGSQPPAGLNFNASWVVHYSMGVQNSGGFSAGITSIERVGQGGNKRLEVHTQDTSPGPNCFVTMALTNPQVTVKIPKQNKSLAIEQLPSSVVTDCGTVQNWCATALCDGSTICDEFQDACVADPNAFCPKVKCANGYVCDEEVDACVGRPCDYEDSNSCPNGMVCANHIFCVTTPCPTDFYCEPAPEVTCEQIGWEGICQGPTLKYCDGDEMISQVCTPGQCEYDEANQYFDCVAQ